MASDRDTCFQFCIGECFVCMQNSDGARIEGKLEFPQDLKSAYIAIAL